LAVLDGIDLAKQAMAFCFSFCFWIDMCKDWMDTTHDETIYGRLNGLKSGQRHVFTITTKYQLSNAGMMRYNKDGVCCFLREA